MLSDPAVSIRRDGTQWIVNESVKAAMLVGAGGHFCPIARWLNPAIGAAPLVVAQEAELCLAPGAPSAWTAAAGIPELYFSRDLKGYGWCFRKGDYLNVGLGRLDRHSLPGATSDFIGFLRGRHKAPTGAAWRWRGHAYHVADSVHRRVLDAGVLLVGDAAGLAYPQSGEGIWPAIESGLAAASTIAAANGDYRRERLEPYERQLAAQYRGHATRHDRFRTAFAGMTAIIGRRLMDVPWFVRRVVLDRWFLRAYEVPRSPGRSSVRAVQ
jgi:flavin-dependent dehydrogenase